MESIPTIIQTGIDLLTSLVDALPDIIATIVAALPPIIDGIINGILGNLPMIVQAGFDLLTALIGALPTIITTIVGALPQIITSIVDALVENIPLIIQTGVELLVSLVKNIPQIIVEIVKAVPPIVQGIVNAFTSLGGKIVEIGKNIISGIWEGITGAASWLWDKVTGWASGLIDGIKGFFGIHSPSTVFAEIGANTIKGFGVGVDDESGKAEKQVLSTMDDLSQSMVNALDGSASEVSILKGVTSSAAKEIESIKMIADSAAKAFCSVFADSQNEFYAVGIEAMNGLNTGIMEQGRVAIESARQIADSIVNEMRRALDIHSPSRKLKNLVGIPAATGLMQGFELGMSDFGQRMRSIVDSEVNKISNNAANQTTSAMTNNVTREIHRTNTVEKIARIEGDGITDELIRMLGLRLKAEERRTGVSFA